MTTGDVLITARDPNDQRRVVQCDALGRLLAAVAIETHEEDTPHISGDWGALVLAVRNDAGGTLVDANGDYAPLQVNNAGQLIIAGGAGGTSMQDDTAFGVGTTQVTPIAGMADEVLPDSVNEGDAGIVRMSLNRNLYVVLRDAAGNERGVNIGASGGLNVEGTAAHDAVATGNPTQLGGVAESTRPAAVADADAVQAWFDTTGRLVIQIGSSERSFISNEYTANQTNTVQIAAPGANLQIIMYDILASTGAAGTLLIEDTAGTRIFGRLSLAINGGWSFNSVKGVAVAANQGVRIDTTFGVGIFSLHINYAILPTL